ncbi:MAG: hypothetical protein K2R98_02785 [Gemmataceae bacterium]|nr:hypothetical protein [Gemmataceae bacterium]
MAAKRSTKEPPSSVISRIVRPLDGTLSPEAAHSILELKFDECNLQRMRELLLKNQDGVLTTAEQQEMEDYRKVGHLFDMLHAKARQSLRRSKSAS